ncbi:MAG: AAA family ATPase [Chlorobium sp.]|uniref:ATP-binding protein n=1 Tax=Chlorobium sp. TaxID=1095 RepID=UPI0025BA0E5E|nr:ATP-binding protein [Chlorobium sp.]MCF8215416.1 AAA family ATPase [Chlorobium sp.]MCF8270254.1 AAA family ATPase [Chlorobium sp.]MCF8286623.1 AAA family ATPase [Chlorobium sp.]MCF8290223.1 AAA family ATPase [Chlorobium sp.]MCF8384382.1 AAA family ATPase [Chlorobium sp.]
MSIPSALPPEKVCRKCHPEEFSFTTTEELDGPLEITGQKRALDAISFSIGMLHSGFNLFALGPNGTGKQTAVMHYLDAITPEAGIPEDWCYVYNFEKPRHPSALKLPPGQACSLSTKMDQLIEALFTVLPAAFSSEDYQAQEKVIRETFQEQQAAAIEELEKRAAERKIALIRTPAGFAFAPVKNGEVLKPDEFMLLGEKERENIEKEIASLKNAMQSIMAQIPKWQREAQEKIKELNRQIAGFAVKPLFSELRNNYGQLEQVTAYLDRAENDIIGHFDHFLEKDGPQQEFLPGLSVMKGSFFNRYKVNVLVDNGKGTGAPVIIEEKPACQNLLGDIEHLSQMGTLVTDFTLIKPGALHRANGGYLLIDARRLLMEPLAWEALKKALRTRQIRIESLAQLYSLVSTVSLDPEPIPLDVKIILLGERFLYYLLSNYDPDFSELFKVAADFEDDLSNTPESRMGYARIIAAIAQKDKLCHFERSAVARIIEHGCRMSGDAAKLSAHMQGIADLVLETDFYARKNNRKFASAEDVQQAIDARILRASRIREKIREATLRNTILIDTESEKTGQINGLAVYGIGEQSFGHPGRITARVSIGKGEVIDIEREVEMGGPIHSKGVLILSGFLAARFGMEQPLSLSATLVFEQSYSGIEGDSASSAELYALLSALSETPIRQWLAVTGSVNQHGEIQAIGGVNEKIEGFFDLCCARGLNGKHGVLIPNSNIDNLMLRADVVEAVGNRMFSIYPVRHIDEGIEILTGIPAGKPATDGNYPEGCINGKVNSRLKEMALKLKKYNTESNGNGQ